MYFRHLITEPVVAIENMVAEYGSLISEQPGSSSLYLHKPLFDQTLAEKKSGLSWGVLLVIGIAVGWVFIMDYKKGEKN